MQITGAHPQLQYDRGRKAGCWLLISCYDHKNQIVWRGGVRYKTALFYFLMALTVGLMLWWGYRVLTGQMDWFLGILGIGVAVFVIRGYLRAYRSSPPPVPGDPPQNLGVSGVQVNVLSLSYIETVLGDAAVQEVIHRDLALTGQIRAGETWCLGLITPDMDQYNPSLLSDPDRMRRCVQDPAYRYYNLERIPLRRSAVVYGRDIFRRPVNGITVINGERGLALPVSNVPDERSRLIVYPFEEKNSAGNYTHLRSLELDHQKADRFGCGRSLPDFLRGEGFPLRHAYPTADPFTTERGGIIINDHGRLAVIRPEYFRQRRLIDDLGNLVEIGQEEDLGLEVGYSVSMRPGGLKNLMNYVFQYGYTPILRYRSFPYPSEYLLPVLDVPPSRNGWADLVVDPRGRGRLFVAKMRTDQEWQEMMVRLRKLTMDSVAIFDYHLLGLTKDPQQMNRYLSAKTEILADYFDIRDIVV
jgi:hypothetical protein